MRHYLLTTDHIGNFDFNFGYTEVLTHTMQFFAGDPVVNELTDWYDYRDSAQQGQLCGGVDHRRLHHDRARLAARRHTELRWHRRLHSTTVYNASLNYRFTPRGALTFIVDNLFDTKPVKDNTWTSYPYYASSWFSPVGRAFFVEASYRFGGSDNP